MNIELSTGLDFFWQWDANLKLKVSDEIPEVHFRFGNKSKAYEVKGGWVSVPNELLQKPDDIECWFYDTEHTMDFGRIEGRRRPKPDGYVYEETEFKSWTELDEKIRNIDIDLTNYVKKNELPTKVSSFENDAGYLTEHQSLDNYALKSEIPTVPTSLKNPNVLTIKVGDQTYTYDGSEAVTIEILDGTEVSY